MRHRFALIIPALNEASTIGRVLDSIPPRLFWQVIVVDNGSTDATAAVARASGAQVVKEPRRGYGQACIAGLKRLDRSVTAIAFMSGDLSDNPLDLEHIVQCLDRENWDMIIGSRALGRPEPGSLTFAQKFGNRLAIELVCMLWQVRFTDLGSLRALRRDALARLDLRDRGFGWNVEMQAKAAQAGMRVCEMPVGYRKRGGGKSKISGTITGTLRAGAGILAAVYRCWYSPLPVERSATRRLSGPGIVRSLKA